MTIFAKKSLNTDKFTVDLTILYIPITKYLFSLFSLFKFDKEKLLKIWKSKMVAASDVILYVTVVAMESN